MNPDPVTPKWAKADQLAFAAYLVAVLGADQQAPNRTQVHKAAYLLKSMGGVPHGFPFALHLHGPYSHELDAALSELSAIGWLRGNRDASQFGAQYTLTERAIAQLPRYVNGWHAYEPVVKAIGKEIMPRGVVDLELLTTAWYVEQEQPEATPEARVQRVKALKPHFSEERVRHGLEEIREIAERVRAS